MSTSCMDNIIHGKKQPEEEDEEEDTSLSDTTFSVSSNRNGNTISSTGDLETDSDDTEEEEEEETNENLVDFAPTATLPHSRLSRVAPAAASSNSRLSRYGSFITVAAAWGCGIAALVSCDFATHQVTWQDMGESGDVRNPCLESEYDHSSERDRMRSDAYEYFCSALVRPHSIAFRGVWDATHDVCIPLFSFDTTSTYSGSWNVMDFTDANFHFPSCFVSLPLTSALWHYLWHCHG